MVAQVKNDGINTLPRGTIATRSVDRAETGAKEASEAIPTAWLGAVYDRVMETLDWVNQEPFDDTYYRNLILTMHSWANPVGLPKEHRSSEANVRRYVRERLERDGLLTAEYLCGNASLVQLEE